MKRFLLFSFVLSNFLWCNAQTKKETEDWLNFYLNKFIGVSNNIVKGQAYADSYSFYGDSLVVSQYNTFGDSASWKLVYINLRKVIKIEIATDTTISPSAHLPCFRIWLYFNVENPPPVTMVESANGRHVRTSWSNPHELDFADWDVLENNMPQRIQKAITHLVDLDGGKIVKEVF